MAKKATIEKFARILHESGREAVEKAKVYRNDVPVKPFCEWADLHEAAREGRRMMARFLLKAKNRRELQHILGEM